MTEKLRFLMTANTSGWTQALAPRFSRIEALYCPASSDDGGFMEGYFATEEQQKAKNWDMLQQGKRERANLSRLGNEIRQVSSSLRILSETLADWENHTLGFHSVEVEISRHDNEGRREGCTIPSHVVATISKTHCDLAEIQKLLREALTSKRTIAQITRELADIEALL